MSGMGWMALAQMTVEQETIQNNTNMEETGWQQMCLSMRFRNKACLGTRRVEPSLWHPARHNGLCVVDA